MTTTTIEWIAADWGTSNVRVWGIDAAGKMLFEQHSAAGMGTLEPGDYPAALASLIDGRIPADSPPLDIVICGMAGAKQGWVEAPYLDTPADLRQLGARAAVPPLDDPRFQTRILSGVCQRTPGSEDVMRGEETQLLGFLDQNPGFSGLVCMPGTHSKWVWIEGFEVTRFATVMTGELFDVLRRHTVLRHTANADEGDPEGFRAGILVSSRNAAKLTHELFTVRAAGLLSGQSPEWLTGYLSGLLVGAEIAAHLDEIGNAPLPLIGAPKLCDLYANALSELGVNTRVVEAEGATLAGLAHARRNIE